MGLILRLSNTNQITELPPLVAAVEAFLRRFEISHEAIDAVQLALDELIANEILWGQRPGTCPISFRGPQDRHKRVDGMNGISGMRRNNTSTFAA